VDFKQPVQYIHYDFHAETIANSLRSPCVFAALPAVESRVCGCRFSKFARSKTAAWMRWVELAAYNSVI
jgi:hypothetical protein